MAGNGQEFTRIPCLNEHPAWIDALEKMAARFFQRASSTERVFRETNSSTGFPPTRCSWMTRSKHFRRATVTVVVFDGKYLILNRFQSDTNSPSSVLRTPPHWGRRPG